MLPSVPTRERRAPWLCLAAPGDCSAHILPCCNAQSRRRSFELALPASLPAEGDLCTCVRTALTALIWRHRLPSLPSLAGTFLASSRRPPTSRRLPLAPRHKSTCRQGRCTATEMLAALQAAWHGVQLLGARQAKSSCCRGERMRFQQVGRGGRSQRLWTTAAAAALRLTWLLACIVAVEGTGSRSARA